MNLVLKVSENRHYIDHLLFKFLRFTEILY
jgi:hypothetical protein